MNHVLLLFLFLLAVVIVSLAAVSAHPQKPSNANADMPPAIEDLLDTMPGTRTAETTSEQRRPPRPRSETVRKGGGGASHPFGSEFLPLVEDPNLGFVSSRLAIEKYCTADYEKICKQELHHQQQQEEAARRRSKAFPEPGTIANPMQPPSATQRATECLERNERKISSELCHGFLQSRRTCLDDMMNLAECADLHPSVVLTDRFNHRRIKLDARRERLELRKKMEGAGDVSLIGVDKNSNKRPRRGGASKSTSLSESAESASLSEAEIRAQQQQQLRSASPSMTASSDEQHMDELFLQLKERYEKDMEEAEKSIVKQDHFMTVCAATMLKTVGVDAARMASAEQHSDGENEKEDDDSRSHSGVPVSIPGISDSCLSGMAGQQHIFNMNHTVLVQMQRLAARKKKMHRQNRGRVDRETKSQKKILNKLREHATRHHLDRLDEEIDSGKANDVPDHEMDQHPHDTARGFLIRQRKERERRRRLHRRQAQEQFAQRQARNPSDPLAPQVLDPHDVPSSSSSSSDPVEEEKSASRSQL